MERIKYDTVTDRDALIAEHAARGLVLKEVQDHLVDGKHLIFASPEDLKTDRERIMDIEAAFEVLKQSVEDLKTGRDG